MFTGPLEQSRPWETKAVVGAYRLLQRVWRNMVDEQTGALRVCDEPADEETRRLLHRTIAAVTNGMETMRFNTAIARITELNNAITVRWAAAGAVPRQIAEPLTLLLAPLAPHIAEELWSRLGHSESLTWTPYPRADADLLAAAAVEVPVQINGKVRAVIAVAPDADADAMQAAARADERIARLLAQGTVRRVVAVPGRLVNFVVG
jgi:leucyl-tRNA synthetase